MEFNKEIIPKFIEAMNHRVQQRQKWLSDEAAKFLSQHGTWNKKITLMELKDLTLPQKVLCIKDYVNGRLRIRKGSYWKLIEYEEHCDTAHGHPRYMVQHPQFPPVFFNLSDKEYGEKYGGMCFDDYFQICDNK